MPAPCSTRVQASGALPSAVCPSPLLACRRQRCVQQHAGGPCRATCTPGGLSRSSGSSSGAAGMPPCCAAGGSGRVGRWPPGEPQRTRHACCADWSQMRRVLAWAAAAQAHKRRGRPCRATPLLRCWPDCATSAAPLPKPPRLQEGLREGRWSRRCSGGPPAWPTCCRRWPGNQQQRRRRLQTSRGSPAQRLGAVPAVFLVWRRRRRRECHVRRHAGGTGDDAERAQLSVAPSQCNRTQHCTHSISDRCTKDEGGDGRWKGGAFTDAAQKNRPAARSGHMAAFACNDATLAAPPALFHHQQLVTAQQQPSAMVVSWAGGRASAI